ncbi:MAG: transcriptional activator NhaR [Polaromonas sp.]|nr:transcriptional activator NhaR [Gemmatimonadaceae bacterium]
MAWLNYHHLLYFWTVAREGSITRAADVLHLTQPGISAQLRTLERALGEKLFERRGRHLALTETGRLVFRYADEIFSVGRELQETLAGRPTGRPSRLVVGVVDSMPKLMIYRLLKHAMQGAEPVRLVLREGTVERLLADLAIHAVDVVLSDAPVPPTVRIKAFSHLLGECGVSIFGTPTLVEAHRRRFPLSLDGAPFLLPMEGTTLRRSLDTWFAELDIQPNVVADIEDSAVLKVFGQAGVGLFAAPTAVEREVRRQYDVRVVGRVEEIRERFYAISAERRIRHPAVLAISQSARSELFA